MCLIAVLRMTQQFEPVLFEFKTPALHLNRDALFHRYAAGTAYLSLYHATLHSRRRSEPEMAVVSSASTKDYGPDNWMPWYPDCSSRDLVIAPLLSPCHGDQGNSPGHSPGLSSFLDLSRAHLRRTGKGLCILVVFQLMAETPRPTGPGKGTMLQFASSYMQVK